MLKTLPHDIKALIVDFILLKKTNYGQLLPFESARESRKDLNQLIGLRALCRNDMSFLSDRFKTNQRNDFTAWKEARLNLVSSILQFNHAHVKLFLLPDLKLKHTTMVAFITRNIEQFDDEAFERHQGVLERIKSRIVSLRMSQKWRLRLSKRGSIC